MQPKAKAQREFREEQRRQSAIHDAAEVGEGVRSGSSAGPKVGYAQAMIANYDREMGRQEAVRSGSSAGPTASEVPSVEAPKEVAEAPAEPTVRFLLANLEEAHASLRHRIDVAYAALANESARLDTLEARRG